MMRFIWMTVRHADLCRAKWFGVNAIWKSSSGQASMVRLGLRGLRET